MNSVAPPQDPELLFLLMAQYSNANLQAEGVEFFSARLKEFEPLLTNVQKALYLSAIGLLRAQNASSAQLPSRFHQKEAAQRELAWCAENASKAPQAGWLREVYYHQGKLALEDGDQAKAQDCLRRSGYKDFDRPITLITPFWEEATIGHAFAPRRISEIVPGRVYALSGFEFTEYYFVVSDDHRELIGIDAGTRPDSAKAAYEALRAYAPGLPGLTTVFITHSHWDPVGGHT